MALYKPDYKMREATELIKNLDDSEENILIKYYIQKKQSWIDEQAEKLKQYREWFEQLNKFLPNNNKIIG